MLTMSKKIKKSTLRGVVRKVRKRREWDSNPR